VFTPNADRKNKTIPVTMQVSPIFWLFFANWHLGYKLKYDCSILQTEEREHK
jgi:hypothetical protein